MAEDPPRGGILQASISLGRVLGIPLGLHYSWFIIAALITFSLTAQFSLTQPEWGPGLIWAVAAATAVLFFISLLAHEMSHALMARSRGIPVHSITLFALGGIAQMEKDANTARTEFLVAIVGPITSMVIGIVCLGVATSLGWSVTGPADGGIVAAVLGWLGSINVLLALFNMLPGYPLDGGRILRAALWGIYGNQDRATRAAARAGQVVAGLFIAVGLLQFFFGAGLGGLWLAFIGWFLLSAAQASYYQVAITETLRDVRVGDIMSSDCVAVDPGTSVQTLVYDQVVRGGRRCFIVRSNGSIRGLVTPHDLRHVERTHWSEVTVGDVMRPLDRLKTVAPDTPAEEAFTTMAREDLNQLPVIEHGDLKGFVSRGHILRLLQTRTELEA